MLTKTKFISLVDKNQKHKLVKVYYKAKNIEDRFYTTCENCNKIIANIAIVKNQTDKEFRVGLDCAETLSWIDFESNSNFQEAKENFTKIKSIRAKISKFLQNKDKAIDEIAVKLRVHKDDKSYLKEIGSSTITFTLIDGRNFWNHYSKDITDILINFISDIKEVVIQK